MKIFITGITGFVGDVMASKLNEKNHEIGGLVRNLSLGDRPGSRLPKYISPYAADITDYLSIREALKSFNPDVIIHLASQTSVAYSFYHPHEVLNTNFRGTVNIADAAREVLPNLKRFVFSGSVEEYGNNPDDPITEESPLIAASPYGVAKIGAEKYLNFLHDAYNFPSVLFRNANSYGRKYNHSFVIENAIYQMVNKEQKINMGDKEPIRDFIYIDDLVDAYIIAAESNDDNILAKPMNLSTGVGVSIEELVRRIQNMTNYTGTINWGSFPPRPCEIWSLVMKNEKAKSLLNWKPKYDLNQGLQKTIEWWQQSRKK